MFEVDELVDHSLEVYEEAAAEYRKGGNEQHGLRLVVLDRGLPDRSGAAEKPDGE